MVMRVTVPSTKRASKVGPHILLRCESELSEFAIGIFDIAQKSLL